MNAIEVVNSSKSNRRKKKNYSLLNGATIGGGGSVVTLGTGSKNSTPIATPTEVEAPSKPSAGFGGGQTDGGGAGRHGVSSGNARAADILFGNSGLTQAQKEHLYNKAAEIFIPDDSTIARVGELLETVRDNMISNKGPGNLPAIKGAVDTVKGLLGGS